MKLWAGQNDAAGRRLPTAVLDQGNPDNVSSNIFAMNKNRSFLL